MSTKLRVNVAGRWYTAEVVDADARPVQVVVEGQTFLVDVDDLVPSPGAPEPESASSPQPPPREEPSPARAPAPPAAATPPAGARVFSSPMPGVIVSVAVEAGAQVVTGDEVCVLEAMKMQQTLRADWTGVVSAVHVSPGQQIGEGDPIASLE